MVKPAFFAGPIPRVIAHRGASGMAPENTMAAFDLAVELGCRYVELDVRLTADKKVVVCHDSMVDRVTEGSGKVANLTYDRLRSLDAGYRFTRDGGKAFPYRGKGVHMPLLEEVLQKHPELCMYIELKDYRPLLLVKVLELLERHGRLDDGTVLVSSFGHRALKRMRRLSPKILTGSSRVEMWQLLLSTALRAPVLFRGKGLAFQLPVRKLGVTCTSPKVVALAHRLGLEVHTYTIDDENEMRRLLDMGVDGLFTNYPDRLHAVIASLGDRK